MSNLEIIASAIGVLAVWLTVRQNRWCWPIGLVMVLMYAWIFFEGKLYSNMLLQGVYATLQLYGWWQWTRGGDQHQGVQVSRLGTRGLAFSLALRAQNVSGVDRSRIYAAIRARLRTAPLSFFKPERSAPTVAA